MRNYSIDKLKLVASFMVVFMHVVNYLPTTSYANFWTYDWYFPLLDLAVPLFFVFSGYFLSKKKTSQIPSYANKIFTMLLAYNIVYIFIKWPMDIISGYLQGSAGSELFFNYFNSFTITSIVTGIFGSEHLWYLSALLYASWLLYYVNKRDLSPRTAFIIGSILFALVLVPPLNFFTNNLLLYGGFVKGYFYLTMGYMIATHQFHYKYKAIHLLVAILLLIGIGSQTDIQIVYESLLALVVFHSLNILKNHPGSSNMFSRLSHYSLGIYLLHIIFTGIFNAVRGFAPVIDTINPFLIVIPMMIICIIGSVILFPLTERFIHQPLIDLFNRILNRLDISSYIK